MSIDERLAHTDFPLPAIRQVNNVKHSNAISLGLGELKDFPVDGQIIEAIQNSLLTDGANYTANAGLPGLRTAIAQNQKLVDGYSYSAENVVITVGVQNALYAVIKTLAKLGATRILIPEIYFGIYRKIPQDFGLEVVTYPLTESFGIDLTSLSNLLLPDDLVIINSPANPTGRVFTIIEQQELAAVLQSKLTHGYLISDEIYSQLIYEGEPATSFSAYFDRTLVLDGISKSAAAAGLRVGWIITQNQKLAQAFTSNNATVISCPPTINQYAAIPVVKGLTKETIEKYNAVLRQNRDVAIALLDRYHIPYIKPTGSFYLFPKISHLLNLPVKQFCLETASQPDGVVVIPGEAFGAPDYIRISLASMQIEEGMERLIRYLNMK